MKKISNLILFKLLILFSVACIAKDYEIWTETIACGEAQFKLISECKPSQEQDDLNDCKKQTLEISNKGIVRKISLPELSSLSARIYKEVGGNIKDLYVIRWGCGQADNHGVLTIYYSIGGGSAPYSEAFSYYDSNGKLIENEKDHIYDKAISDGNKRMKSVHSIMPD